MALVTGQMGATMIRAGFADCDEFGNGFVSRVFGSLDAPDFMPQGSMKESGTSKRYARQSVAFRDTLADCAQFGYQHDR